MPEENNYAPTVQETLSDKYNGTYFSGAQCEVWIGDYKLDEAIEIEGVYTMDQIPIYGYASRHFNTAVGGRVVVNASLIINYKYEGYLYAYIKAAKEKKKNGNVLDILNKKYALPKTNTTTKNPTDPSNAIDKEVVEDIEQLQNITKADILAYQDKIWGQADNFSPFATNPRLDFIGPFNIKIRDFKIGYSKDSSTTEKELINCFVNRYATVRRVDGSPVVEVYQILAMSLL